MRRLSNGNVDNSFSGDGEMTFTYNGSGDDTEVEAVAIDSSNRIVVAGYNGGVNRHAAVARITTSGNLDTSFDGDGINTFIIAGGELMG